MAFGLDSERLLAQWREIDQFNERLEDDFAVLKGIECDILEQGGLPLAALLCGFLLLDRLDEPTLVSGDPARMQAILRPMLDNKFLQQQGIGVLHGLLPAEAGVESPQDDGFSRSAEPVRYFIGTERIRGGHENRHDPGVGSEVGLHADDLVRHLQLNPFRRGGSGGEYILGRAAGFGLVLGIRTSG